MLRRLGTFHEEPQPDPSPEEQAIAEQISGPGTSNGVASRAEFKRLGAALEWMVAVIREG